MPESVTAAQEAAPSPMTEAEVPDLDAANQKSPAAAHKKRWTPPDGIIANHGELHLPHTDLPGSHQLPDGLETDKTGTANQDEEQPRHQQPVNKHKSRASRKQKKDAQNTEKAEGGDDANADAEDPALHHKPKRKYVRSGKFIGKFDYQKHKQKGASREARQQEQNPGNADGKPAEPVNRSSSAQPVKVPESPFADESSQENPSKRKRGRPPKAKSVTQPAAAGAADTAAEPATHEPAMTKPPACSKSGGGVKPKRSGRGKRQKHEEVQAEADGAAVAEAAGEAVAEAGAEADSQAQLEMARKASTGDGSRLERAHADSNDEAMNSNAASAIEVQQHNDLDETLQLPQQILGDSSAAALNEVSANGVRVFNPVAAATKPPHRLSRVSGREASGSGGSKQRGENGAVPHMDDSTFGEYMAALERRSSSGGRRLSSSGNSGRLMEMLHGSDGWEKLALQLQQKEEEEAKHQQAAQQEEEDGKQQPKQPGSSRKRRQPAVSDALPKAVRQKRAAPHAAAAAAAAAVSGGSTEDSRASRPKRSAARFDYNVLNGTSGDLDAMLCAAEMQRQEDEQERASKPKVRKAKQTKLDKDGNQAEVTVFAKAYNRVKAQFVRIRREEEILRVYGADALGGQAKERIKLQSELDRAQEQIVKCQAIIRECVKFCEEAEGDKAIPSEHFDDDGELPEEFIFCAKCLKGESGEDNDIVLCDGDCNRGYHEQCLQPRIHAAQLPEDEGWLCPACDAKADIILAINEEFETEYDQEAPWHTLFADRQPSKIPHQDAPEEGTSGNGPVTFLSMDLAASDSDDSSFGSDDLSDKQEGDAAAAESGSSDEVDSPGQSSGSADSGLSSGESDSASSSKSDLLEREEEEEDLRQAEVDVHAPRAKRRRATKCTSQNGRELSFPSNTAGASASEDASDIIDGKRRRQQVDYKALNDSMFGNTECYDGEGLSGDDDEYAPDQKRRRAHSDSD